MISYKTSVSGQKSCLGIGFLVFHNICGAGNGWIVISGTPPLCSNSAISPTLDETTIICGAVGFLFVQKYCPKSHGFLKPADVGVSVSSLRVAVAYLLVFESTSPSSPTLPYPSPSTQSCSSVWLHSAAVIEGIE